MTKRSVKVRIEVTLEVDPEAWAEEYGCEPSEVRADVKRWAQTRLDVPGFAEVVVREVPDTTGHSVVEQIHNYHLANGGRLR